MSVTKSQIYCPFCGTQLDVDDQREFIFCAECGDKIDLLEHAPWKKNSEVKGSLADNIPAQPAPEIKVVENRGWKTSTGFSWLGLACLVIVNAILGRVSSIAVIPGLILSIAFFIAGPVYALAFHPKRFKPGVTFNASSCKSISFLNLFFGGPIFGSLWNSNLTRNESGVSFIIYVIFQVIILVLELMLAFTS